ncbi:EthD domain-containing protein [Variovorax paradoxus B4]|uniref:EthD domain-containing protein n=1 Tax=Variovorax paradoxus B4 TaxID=1246301 RepID=T1XLT6_VARPD|nr:EthD domain-containing protein [Variovorax paradoxus]AGU53254.1 EthD domain-containing protein [Variovorax paradoxus B4]
MNVRMGLIRKKTDWSAEDFRSYWRDRHGPLAACAPGLRGYWQNAVTERLQRGIDFARGPWDFDGFSQLWFDDVEHADQAFKDGKLAADLVADERHFLGSLHIVTAEQRVVIEVPQPQARARLLKRISTLKRRPELSEDNFRREWKIHGDLVRKMPGVGAYRQNVVVARELVKGEPCGYEDLPIDGVVELWFENADTLQAAFSSRAGQTTMAHAKTFLDEITAFLVEEHRVA